jgi:hypothetical protein
MGWKVISIVFPAAVVSSVLEAMPRKYSTPSQGYTDELEIWLRIWTEKADGSKDAGYAGGYIGLVVASMILALLNIE